MSNYDDALSLIENEVNRDCEYYVYSQLRDCIDTIEDDCKLLESENAKLQRARQTAVDDALSIAEMMINARADKDRVESENAKLRELVKSMYYDLTHMTFPPDWVTDYEADMRELGVEVDE